MSKMLVLLVTLVAVAMLRAQPDPAWTTPVEPFRIAGNIYYVGSEDLASYLITTPDGHILINSAQESNVPLIAASVAKLGFSMKDVRVLLISHAHWDHCAGSAALLQRTSARYMVMQEDVDVVRSGGVQDFHYGSMKGAQYPPTTVDRILHDGDTVSLGGTNLVANRTAGHTKGCTTWTLKVREGGKELQAVIVGSVGVNPGYRLVGDASYPGIDDDYQRSFETLRGLWADIFLGAHGSYFGLLKKMRLRKSKGMAAFVDPKGYQTYVASMEAAYRRERASQMRSTFHRRVAITIDDLPFVRGDDLRAAQRATTQLLHALKTDSVQAAVFVTGSNMDLNGETNARKKLLRAWRDGGHALHNHTYSHDALSTTPTDAYLRDVERGQQIVDALLFEGNHRPEQQYFRAPYNDLGGTREKRDSLVNFLHAHHVQLAPFTVEHGDYIYNAVYRMLMDKADTASAERLIHDYLDHLDSAFAFAERTSSSMFGHEIPQIFLIHANVLNARCLPAMLERLRSRGYSFVSFPAALADPAYQTEDAYLKKWGVSWLHRWRVAMHLPSVQREEPSPPGWIMKAYEARPR